MAWTIEYTGAARTEIRKLDRNTARRIRDFLHGRVISTGNPRDYGKALAGPLSGLWSYRVGDYRILAEIRDNVMTVLVVRVGHRGNIFDRP